MAIIRKDQLKTDEKKRRSRFRVDFDLAILVYPLGIEVLWKMVAEGPALVLIVRVHLDLL